MYLLELIKKISKGGLGGPFTSHEQVNVEVPGNSLIGTDGLGRPKALSLYGVFDGFNVIPTSSTAPLKLVESGTSALAQATKGGLALVTGGSSGNIAVVTGLAGGGATAPITNATRLRFAAQVTLPSIANILVFAGLNENQAAADVDPTNSTGDGCGFYFGSITDGTNVTATTLNMSQKIAGADTFASTGITMVAAAEYDLVIEIGADRIPVFYVNGVNVSAGATFYSAGDVATPLAAHTADANVKTFVAVKTTTGAAKTMNVRYVEFGRRLG